MSVIRGKLGPNSLLGERAVESRAFSPVYGICLGRRSVFPSATAGASQPCHILNSGAIKQISSFALPRKLSLKMLSTKIDNSFLWKHVKDITGQSHANKLPSALQSDQGPISNPQEIINEMNLDFAKVSDRLIKDKRPFSDRNADVLKEFINSKKPENDVIKHKILTTKLELCGINYFIDFIDV